MAMQALLHVLEEKKILPRNERVAMLDGVSDEIRDKQKRSAMSPNAQQTLFARWA